TSDTTLPEGASGLPYNTIFTAINGTTPYLWSVEDGTLPEGVELSENGVLSGTPVTVGSFLFTVRISDSSTPPQSADCEINLIVIAGPVSILTETLPAALVDVNYSADLNAIGGTLPYSWSVLDGELPDGIELSTEGSLSGISTTAGTFVFTVTVTDSSEPTQSESLELTLIANLGAPRYYWTRRIGALGSDYGTGVCADSAGNVYTTGYFSNEVNFAEDWSSQDNKFISGVFVTKMNDDGDYSWTRRLGGRGEDERSRGPAVCADLNNNIYVSGAFGGTVNFAEEWSGSDLKTSSGSINTFVTKLNADGSYGWTHVIGTATSQGYAICTDTAGNIYVTGYFTGNSNFSSDWGLTNTKTNAGFDDIFITRINANGSYSWTKRIGGTRYDRAYAVCTDSGDNIFLTGSFTSTTNFAEDWNSEDTLTASGEDIFITKIYANGEYAWTYKMGAGGLFDRGYSVCSDENDNIYIAGIYGGTVNFGAGWGENDTKTSIGVMDGFVTKIYSAGTYYWTHTIGALSDTITYSVCADISGNVYLAGCFTQNLNFAADWSSEDTKTGLGFFDPFVTKIESTGEYGWTRKIGSTGADYGSSVCADSNGNVYLTGRFENTINFALDWGAEETKSSAGGFDVFITKMR
ncbi:MAG: SBBP repeat-containing protein, partial [Planctomycetota bacterium]